MPLRATAKEIFLEALKHVRVPELMRERIQCGDGLLRVGELVYSLGEFARIMIVAIGKAAVPMCDTLVTLVQPVLSAAHTLEGIAVGVGPSSTTDPRIRFLRGGHPLPDQRSQEAAAAILQLLETADETTLVFFLISGGASAMVEQALDRTLFLEEIVLFHSALVRSGLPITHMNVLRKHFSRVKGGRLALAAHPATQCTLLIADVPANALDMVGSGPSLPDPSTVDDCLAILKSTHLDLSPRVLALFHSPQLEETPKADHPAFRSARWISLISSDDLCQSAASFAASLGFVTIIDNSCDDWDYRGAARYLVDSLVLLQREHRKVCLLSAGEVTVAVGERHGRGGRNQQFVLECARLIAAEDLKMTILSGGSDGVDGNSSAAGAVCDETTWARAASAGLSVIDHLENFNSFVLFEALGDTIHTGPTGNNVRDLRILLSVLPDERPTRAAVTS